MSDFEDILAALEQHVSRSRIGHLDSAANFEGEMPRGPTAANDALSNCPLTAFGKTYDRTLENGMMSPQQPPPYHHRARQLTLQYCAPRVASDGDLDWRLRFSYL